MKKDKVTLLITFIALLCILVLYVVYSNNPRVRALKYLRSNYDSKFDVSVKNQTRNKRCRSDIEGACIGGYKTYNEYVFDVIDDGGFNFEMKCSDFSGFYCTENYSLHVLDLKVNDVFGKDFDYKYTNNDYVATIIVYGNDKSFNYVYSEFIKLFKYLGKESIVNYNFIYVRSKSDYVTMINDKIFDDIASGSISRNICGKTSTYRAGVSITKENGKPNYNFDESNYPIIIASGATIGMEDSVELYE